MSANDEIMIRAYSEGDETSILRLFAEVFNEHRTLEHWRWQYKSPDRGASWVVLAQQGSRILGHAGAMRQNLNFLGREIPAAQNCDAMINKNFRGRQVFSKLGRYQQELATTLGGEAIFAFASRNSSPGSYPMFMRNLDYTRIANLRYYYLRTGINKLFGEHINKIYRFLFWLIYGAKHGLKFSPLRKGISVETTKQLPDELEKTLKQIRYYEVLSVWKDVPYLRWRYENHAEYRYTFHILRVKGQPDGLVVTRECRDHIAICEVLHRRKDVEEMSLLVGHVLLYWIKLGAQRFEFYGYDNGFFDAVFSAAGFNVRSFSKFIFIGKVLKQSRLEEMFALPDNWTVSYGDTDSI
ncbi:MAG: GNAT family N-acetyltransferase [Anaerolineaceae bacterium]